MSSNTGAVRLYKHPQKGVGTFTFSDLSSPDYIYYIMIHYDDNQYAYFPIRTLAIPESNHFQLMLDYEQYLRYNITYHNLVRWLGHLDKAYDLYAELVGYCPDEGRKIKIMASEEDYGDMWIDSRSTNIYWNHNSIVPTLRRINYQDDWSFGALHEIGHLFDPDNTWNFDGEFFANFKMAYVLFKNDNNFKVFVGNRWITNYRSLIDYYCEGYSDSINGYPQKYSNDGLTYMFLNLIDLYGSWDSVKAAFHDYINEYPNNNKPSFTDFINKISKHGTNNIDFASMFRNYYSYNYIFVLNHFYDQGIN